MARASKKRKVIAAEVVDLPRKDVTDDELVSAIASCFGAPSLVADKFSMSIADLLERAKSSKAVAAAFMEAKQRQVDKLKLKALSIAMGDSTTPPDVGLIKWFVERYE